MFWIFIILIILYIVSFLFSINTRTLDKLSAYECGLEPIGNARLEFKIIYYIIGLLYLIFDLEIIFLFPLATTLTILNSWLGFISVMFFFILLTLAFIYEWYQGALELN